MVYSTSVTKISGRAGKVSPGNKWDVHTNTHTKVPVVYRIPVELCPSTINIGLQKQNKKLQKRFYSKDMYPKKDGFSLNCETVTSTEADTTWIHSRRRRSAFVL